MSVIYDPRSFYALTTVRPGFLDLLVPPAIVLDGEESPYTVEPKYQHRPDRLAYDLYGSSKLWWVFAAANRDQLEDPVWDFVSGLKITLPSPNSVKRFG